MTNKPAQGGNRMPRLAPFAFAAIATLALTGTAHAATPLHTGSKGQRVCAAQWLLSGHKPSAYTWLRPYKLPTPQPSGAGCQYGKKMVAATREAKRQLGFKLYWNGTAGRDFLEILQGKRARPIGYVVRAARVAAVAREIARKKAAANTVAAAVVRIARREVSYGVVEIPWGSNTSPRIAVYQSFTGAYRAPWCVSFGQAVYAWAGAGTFANRSAGVFYVVGWARAHGYLRATPKPGDSVAFMDRLGHWGIVLRVTAYGIETAEGNASNRTLIRFHPFSNHRPKAYMHLPSLDRRAA